jgi:hypothetical protein
VDGGALVFWNAPANDGSSPITGYTVTVRQSGTLLRTVTLGVTDFTVLTGLTNGVSYDVAIAARNLIGTGATASLVVVPSTVTASPVVSSVPTPVVGAVVDTGGQNVKRDLQVNFATRRLVFVEGDLVFCMGAQAILQDVWLALGFFEGEWFLDETVGVPYFQAILVKGPNMDQVRSIYREKILSRRGVLTVLALTLDLDRPARTLAVAFRLNTDVGQLASSRVTRIGG